MIPKPCVLLGGFRILPGLCFMSLAEKAKTSTPAFLPALCLGRAAELYNQSCAAANLPVLCGQVD